MSLEGCWRVSQHDVHLNNILQESKFRFLREKAFRAGDVVVIADCRHCSGRVGKPGQWTYRSSNV